MLKGSSVSIITELVHIPVFIYIPFIISILAGISMLICKFKCKLELIPKIAFIAFVILVTYYWIALSSTSAVAVRRSKALNVVEEAAKLENVFPPQINKVNFIKKDSVERPFTVFGKLSYEENFEYEEKAEDTSKILNLIHQEVVCFENTPLLNEDRLINFLKANFKSNMYFGSYIENEDIISGEINNIKYQYVFKRIYEESVFNYDYCYSLLMYNENAVLAISNYYLLNDDFEFDPLANIRQVADITKDIFIK